MTKQNIFLQFVTNKVIIFTFLGWFVAQTIKVALGVINEKRFNFKWFVGTGGMPSSHASGVTAMTIAVGLYHGVDTALFAVTLMFTVVVICDAQGVRQATGKQAEILNTIMDDIYWKKKIQEKKLKELIGHTPVQVLAGILVGIFVGVILQFLV